MNWLIAGKSGSGKTHLTSTARQPILCHSFDPQGCALPCIESLVAEHKYIVLNQCEFDDARAPQAFQRYTQQFGELLKAGLFNHLGTYAIDGLTGLADTILYEIMRKKGQPGEQPKLPDYYTFKEVLKNVITKCVNLPCDFILVSHIANNKDEVTGEILRHLFVSGQSAEKLPSYFGEYYLATTETIGTKEQRFTLVTKPYNGYDCKTRIGSGIFELREVADLTALRGKAKRSTTHLPPLQL